jgi:phospholipid/cholesterol/gamma-HCH transport system permease protein
MPSIPIRFLVVPRVVATTIMMICIAVVGDVRRRGSADWSPPMFLGVSSADVPASHVRQRCNCGFHHRMVKAGVFGVLISGLACRLGLSVTGGAQGVGVATTRTVVLTIVALIGVDLIFTAVFYLLGW